MDADGSNQTRLTTSSEEDDGPDWSPDGTKIVFYFGIGSVREIYVMDADGSNQARLTDDGAYATFP